jgi:hypothetical protein
MNIKPLFLSVMMLVSATAWADPAPFGLEIGKTTIKEMQAKYSASNIGENKYSGGEMYSIKPSQIEFDGLQEITTVFSKDGQLLAVLTTLPKNKFEYLYESMGKKYKLISKEIPFVGNKSAKYVNGNTEISLDAPHLSFEMTMNYISKDLQKAFEAQSATENAKKKSKESSQL